MEILIKKNFMIGHLKCQRKILYLFPVMKYQMTDLSVCLSLKKLGALCKVVVLGKEPKNCLWQYSHSLGGFLLCLERTPYGN